MFKYLLKLLPLVYLYLCCSSIWLIHAQVQETWVARYNGPGNSSDAGQVVAVGNNGNVYVAGWTGGGAAADYITLKYDSAGAQQWVQTYNGPANGRDVVSAMCIDGSGNVYVTGASVGDSITAEFVTIKYDNSGIQQWVQRYSAVIPNSLGGAASIAVDNNGNVYVTGVMYFNKSNGGIHSDYVTIKYNSAGIEQWVRRYDGGFEFDDESRAVAIDTNGNAYVTGWSQDSLQVQDIVTIKYNSAGVQQWIDRYHLNVLSQQPYDIALGKDGNIYVAGKGFTIKYTPAGSRQWAVQSDANLFSMAVDSNNNVYVVGYGFLGGSVIIKYNSSGVQQWLQSFSEFGFISIAVDNDGNSFATGSTGNPNDYATVKYDSSGVEQWVQRYDGPANGLDVSNSIAVDNNGNVYVTGHSVGIGTGADITTIKYSQGMQITRPQTGELWIAGEKDTIRWSGGQTDQFVSIEYSTDNGQTFNLIELATPADSQYYVWDIPKTLISTHSKIRLSDFQTSTVLSTTDTFKIKPYIITKLDDNGNYIAYDRGTDAWGFSNNPADMWPQSWYSQFNYRGIDRFTNQQYPQQGLIAFKVAPDSIYPDWVSWVNTYGVNACYFNVSPAVYNLNAILSWQKFNSTWKGSCFGISASNALAFQVKNNFQTRYPNFPDFTNPINVMSDTNVIPVINELFTHQSGNPTRQAWIGRLNVVTPNQTLNEIKSMLREDNVKIRTLTLLNNNGAGGHSILVYSLEQDATQKELYYLFVYDNSYPNNLNALVLIDTTGNSNQGIWLTTYGWTTWGGPKKLMLEIESVNYLSNATLPKNNGTSTSPFILDEDQLEVSSGINSNITIIDMLGNITGFINGQVFEDIPESVPLSYLNGSETPPYSYSLPTNNYSVVLNEFSEDVIESFFFTGNKSFSYERTGATNTQSDRLFFDGGVSVVNPDVQNKTVRLLNLINETSQEKLAVLSSLELAQNDSVKIENPDSNKVKIISYGSAKDYDIELNYSTANGIGRFANSGIVLTANTSHTLLPDWTNLTNSQLIVLVDVGNDGTIDDTITVINTVDVDDKGSLGIPQEFNLAQNYPNPFNPVTTIKYSIPQRSNVIIIVYDVLGNEVTTLVNEEKDKGVYTVKFDASNMASGISAKGGYASGVYFYQLQAGNFIETKKMLLIK